MCAFELPCCANIISHQTSSWLAANCLHIQAESCLYTYSRVKIMRATSIIPTCRRVGSSFADDGASPTVYLQQHATPQVYIDYN